MNATVCFFLAATLQCHNISFVRHWPAEGTGARVCSDTADGFRCQNISRQDGFELIREHQCAEARYDERRLPEEMKRNESDAKRRISYARLKIEMAEKNAKWWKEHPPNKPNGPDAARNELIYKENELIYKETVRLMKDQLQQLQWARDELARAIKSAEDVGPANVRAVANVEARIEKWCRAEGAASHANPTAQFTIPKPAAFVDRNPQDFPLASCKSWNGTVTERSGIDSENAFMRGIVTRANVEEYCDRIVPDDKPARDTAVADCLQDILPTATKEVLSARANCTKATLEFSDGTGTKRIRFPIEDTSCGSGNPPLISQFRKLCPKKASELALE